MNIKDFPLDVITKYNNREVSVRQLSIDYNCSQSTVKRFLERNGVIVVTKEQFLDNVKTLPDALSEEITKQYELGISMPKIAKRYNVPIPTLRSYFKRHNINYKSSPWLDKMLTANIGIIVKMYEECESLEPIAVRFNCSPITIANFFDRHNIPRKNNGRDHIPGSDKELVYKMHHEQMLTMTQIGKHYGCSAPTAAKFFDSHNIVRRSKAETSALTAQNPETIKKQRRSLFSCKPYCLPSGQIIKLQGYEPQFLDYIFQNGLLNECQIDYNPKRILYTENGKKRYYFPDFYIPHLNLVVEIKSSWIYKKQGIKNNELKALATKGAGFDYLLVLDNDYSLLNTTINPRKY